MGQAKRRGTFEQRREEGILKRERAKLERLARKMLREASRSPEDRAALLKARQILAWASGQGMLV